MQEAHDFLLIACKNKLVLCTNEDIHQISEIRICTYTYVHLYIYMTYCLTNKVEIRCFIAQHTIIAI